MKTPIITIAQVQDAIMAHWLRFGEGPNVDEIAALLKVKAPMLRRFLRGTAPKTGWNNDELGLLDDARVPGFITKAANRHYHTHVTWEPGVEYLRALVRGEREHEHEWLVRALVMPLGQTSFGGLKREYKVIARTEGGARKQAKALALAEFPGGLHDNSSFRHVEWLGKHFVSTPATIDAAIARAEAGGIE